MTWERYVLFALAITPACAVATDPAEEPTEQLVPEPEPAERDTPDNSSAPTCTPDVAYDVGGKIVVVPGYCPERAFERPTIGDPDPSLPWVPGSERAWDLK